MISLSWISSANSRKYFVDVYTGKSVISFEFTSIDSCFVVIGAYVVKAQVISVYSYLHNPYNYGNQNIYQGQMASYLAGVIPRYYRRYFYRGRSQDVKSLSCYRSSGQYRSDFSKRISRRRYYWRSGKRESETS